MPPGEIRIYPPFPAPMHASLLATSTAPFRSLSGHATLQPGNPAETAPLPDPRETLPRGNGGDGRNGSLPMATRRHILIAEDDADIRNVLHLALQFSGYLPHCTEDGEAAWSALTAEPFDLVITDNNMPRLTGLGLLRRLREKANAVPVIILSGDLPWDDAPFRRLLAPGLMLAKPASLGQVLAGIRQLLAAPDAVGAVMAAG